MEDLLSLVVKYGWQISLLGVLGSCLVGLIKTPIRTAVFKRITGAEQIKKTENAFDTVVFIGTFLLAAGISAIYLAAIKDFTWGAVLGTTVQTWLVQSVTYGIWKKLGVKRLLVLIFTSIKKAFVKHTDTDQDGKVSFTEVSSAITNLIKDGKIDLDKVLSTAEAMTPGVVEEILHKVTQEAGTAGQIDPAKEIDKLTSTVKEAITVTSKKIKNKTPEIVDIAIDIAVDKANDVISNIPTIKF